MTVFDEKVEALVQDLIDTMEAQNGAGIAAPQLGVSSRVLIVAGDPHLVLINPEIIERSSDKYYPDFTEGCLSVPGRFALVSRYWLVRVRYQDLAGTHRIGTFSNRNAVVVQHELDHLNGILFIDHVEDNTVANGN